MMMMVVVARFPGKKNSHDEMGSRLGKILSDYGVVSCFRLEKEKAKKFQEAPFPETKTRDFPGCNTRLRKKEIDSK